MQITNAGQAGDDVYIYNWTHLADSTVLDSDIDNNSATALVEDYVLSNDNYMILKGVAPTVGAGARTFKYKYQGWMIS
jgi:hypothetical protein